MGITCPNCGKTNIAPGITQCPVCHAPVTMTMTTVGMGGSLTKKGTPPILVDARGRRYTIMNTTSPTLIGSRGCGILLSAAGIPAQAAKLAPRSGGGFNLEDLCGSVSLNGTLMKGTQALAGGDKIGIGTVVLTYQGPAASYAAPPPPPPVAIVPSPPPPLMGSLPPPPPPMVISSAPTGITLKTWGPPPPLVEGFVELMDGPHRVEKGSMAGKVAGALALSVISSSLAMIPFWSQREVNVWFMRVKNHVTGVMVNVVMRGEPGNLPQMGDFIAVWGSVKDGNVLMSGGYSYTTDSLIKIKR